MPLIDYHRFFEDAEDFLVPPGLKDRGFESVCKETMEKFRGVKYADIDNTGIFNFVYGMSRKINPLKVEDVFYRQWMRVSDVACSELIVRRNNGTTNPSPAALMEFTSLEWMIEEHAKNANKNSTIFQLLDGTEGVWIGDRFTPSEDARLQMDLLRSFVLDGLWKISDHQIDQYRKIPLQIGAMYRLKGKSAAESEVVRLLKYLETRPSSRPYVVKALIESRLPAGAYMKQLKNTERGQALDLGLGL